MCNECKLVSERFEDALPLGFSPEEFDDDKSSFPHVDHCDAHEKLVVYYEEVVLGVH